MILILQLQKIRAKKAFLFGDKSRKSHSHFLHPLFLKVEARVSFFNAI